MKIIARKRKLSAVIKRFALFALAFAMVLSALPVFVAAESDPDDEELIEYYRGILEQPNALLGTVFATFEHGTSAEDKYAALYSAAKELYPEESDNALSKRVQPFNNDDVGILEVEDEDTLAALVIVSKKQRVLFAEPNYSLPKDGWSYTYDPGDAKYRGAYTLGDGNGDGYITAGDYAMAKRTVLGTYYPATQESFDALDIDGDGNITASDYLKIKRYCLGTYYFAPF